MVEGLGFSGAQWKVKLKLNRSPEKLTAAKAPEKDARDLGLEDKPFLWQICAFLGGLLFIFRECYGKQT